MICKKLEDTTDVTLGLQGLAKKTPEPNSRWTKHCHTSHVYKNTSIVNKHGCYLEPQLSLNEATLLKTNPLAVFCRSLLLFIDFDEGQNEVNNGGQQRQYTSHCCNNIDGCSSAERWCCEPIRHVELWCDVALHDRAFSLPCCRAMYEPHCVIFRWATASSSQFHSRNDSNNH